MVRYVKSYIRRRINFWWMMWVVAIYRTHASFNPADYGITSKKKYSLRRYDDTDPELDEIIRLFDIALAQMNWQEVDRNASRIYRIVRKRWNCIPKVKTPPWDKQGQTTKMFFPFVKFDDNYTVWMPRSIRRWRLSIHFPEFYLSDTYKGKFHKVDWNLASNGTGWATGTKKVTRVRFTPDGKLWSQLTAKHRLHAVPLPFPLPEWKDEQPQDIPDMPGMPGMPEGGEGAPSQGEDGGGPPGGGGPPPGAPPPDTGLPPPDQAKEEAEEAQKAAEEAEEAAEAASDAAGEAAGEAEKAAEAAKEAAKEAKEAAEKAKEAAEKAAEAGDEDAANWAEDAAEQAEAAAEHADNAADMAEDEPIAADKEADDAMSAAEKAMDDADEAAAAAETEEGEEAAKAATEAAEKAKEAAEKAQEAAVAGQKAEDAAKEAAAKEEAAEQAAQEAADKKSKAEQAAEAAKGPPAPPEMEDMEPEEAAYEGADKEEDVLTDWNIDLPARIEPNKYGCKKLGIRFEDRSGDPYTFGYSKRHNKSPIRIGDIVNVEKLTDKKLSDYRNSLGSEEQKWNPWHKNFLFWVWKDEYDKGCIAHWYELSYLRYHLHKVDPNPDNGGIMSNDLQLKRFAPYVYSRWGKNPIPDNATGILINEEYGVMTIHFTALRYGGSSSDYLQLDVLPKEVRVFPFVTARDTTFDRLRPRKPYGGRPPINDWIWDVSIMTQGPKAKNLDPEEIVRFNVYMRNRVETEILTKFVRPSIISKKARSHGRYKKVRGIKATDKKPLITSSMATFGKLLWESKYGWHREFVEDKGRVEGGVGVLSVLWTKSDSYSSGVTEYIPWNFEVYYRAWVTMVNLIEANAEKGNLLNFDITPGDFENQNCMLGPIENRLIFPISYRGTTPKPQERGLNIFTALITHSSATSNHSIRDIFTQSQIKALNSTAYAAGLSSPGRCADHPGTRLEYTYNGIKKKRAYCDKGDHYPDYAIISKGKSTEVGFHLQRRRIQGNELEAFIDTLHRLAPEHTDLIPFEWMNYIALNEDEAQMPHEKRGTAIVITSNEYFESHLEGWQYLRWLDIWADVYMIDVGQKDYSNIFKYEPEFLRSPKWQCIKCKKTQKYDFDKIKVPGLGTALNPKDPFKTGQSYPPTCCNKPMMPIGKPMVNYIYVGNDIENMPYHVLKATGTKLGEVEFD